ncbi:ANTAR domain-containing protein [Yinghuangia sp. KLBMP8922]|uniref:ANTAR domain-containing protein n=2 Tax=Yinghuangia soli TaxID=2908204 RepID=A0AA41Q8T1_9ACTN|nr:ANTAR domain-containing protein [Yinghuangia soli]
MSSATASHPLCSTDEVSEQLEELQLTLGEGPCMDACARGTAVLAPDLSTGALDLYAETPGDLGPGQFADAVAFADTAALLLLESHPAGREELFPSAVGCSPDLRALDLTSEDLGGYRAEIEATGVLAEHLGSGVDEAFLRLRAHAYTHGRRLAEVARDVVARTLRFRPDPAHVRPHDLEQPDDGS